jgi:hypothetical protein
MAIIHDEHCHVVDYKKAGDPGTMNSGKGCDAGGRSSGHNLGGRLSGGGSSKTSDRDQTLFGSGKSSDSRSTGNQSTREHLHCFNTKKCAGKKHYLSDCPHTRRDEAIVLLSEYKNK